MKNRNILKRFKAYNLVIICLYAFVFNCGDSTNQKKEQVNNGESLAKIHCARCHKFPEPEVMPKRYWKEVLPIMGAFFGKLEEGKVLNDFNNKIAKKRLTGSGLFPNQDILTDEEWKAINLFYEENSPENLPQEVNHSFNSNLKLFNKEVLPWKTKGDGLTYLNFDDKIYHTGFNTHEASYYTKLDAKGNIILNKKLPYPLVDVVKNGKAELLLLMGAMYNVDQPTGGVLVHAEKKLHKFVGNLERPVDFLVEDFDNNGAMDILVAEFGKYLGGINIYSKKNKIEKTNIHSKPGATKFVLGDVNKDGLKDFYVLISQEDESIYLFLNTGNLTFKKEQLITLPPYYGTTHFELLDLDNDGDEDIITSSGDSDDFVSALKPYHGIRIFENLGDRKYEQVWFHKQEGAYGTACADYDNDGDIDIASIGYYASLENKDEEGFLFFENIGASNDKWKFKSFTLPNTSDNCFMLIKSEDIDNDGDLDILLGSNTSIFSKKRKASVNENWHKNGGVVTILRNTTFN